MTAVEGEVADDRRRRAGGGMTAHPYCLEFCYPAEGQVCADCPRTVAMYGGLVRVARVGGAPLCDQCAEESGLGDLAAGLNMLDTFVGLAGDLPPLAAVLAVQRAVRYLVENEWLPLLADDDATPETGAVIA